MEEGEQAPRWRRRETPYQRWQKEEGIPVVAGSYVGDLYSTEVAPWPRIGQAGAFVNLADQEQDDGWVIEIAPGGQTEVLHHFFEASTYILTGHGATTFWQEGHPKQTVEWGRGSLFSPPLNCYYQHFNHDGQHPARMFTVTNAPMMINLMRSVDWVFGDSYVFADRYDGRENYFTDPGKRITKREWATNFVPDVRTFTLEDNPGRGIGNVRMGFAMAGNQLAAHMSEFPSGHYKQGHWHGVGAHVIILSGQGYSLLWFDGEERRKVDWKDGSVLSPKEGEWHQHFNTGQESSRYLAIRLGGLDTNWSSRAPAEAGFYSGIAYDHEDPAIYDLYASECTRNGAKVVMPRPNYVATG
ncbi:MAG: Gentisate 1,2-dioxygenase [Chloroflexi bacterium]|nr:Gentisate 1,2-dioxygenase [Chloroflexota bacterium]